MDSVRRNKKAIILFMFPATLLFLTIIILPIIMSGYYSLLEWNGMTKGTFIGFKNYIELFTSPSAGFVKTLGNAILLAVLSVVIQLPISLGLALLLAKGIKGERFFVSAFFVPVLISTVVIGQLWTKIYNPEYGIINVVLRSMGLEHWTRTWLGDQNTALFA
ncbi:MAG: sugar ABC transporter permease, partial [Lachnospiraceae bacterium]|nr:sugar ABC transporter permease [Lachnospiraceae bacterium]